MSNHMFTYSSFAPFQLAKCQGVCYYFHAIAADPFNQSCKRNIIDAEVD